jgi:meso-butanediol dehydrogenase / (S,S)-butanediol dehydrogenase / diacetyl reductase
MARTIVITGAGDGLGRALARRFASDGDTVVLLGRTLAKVEAVAQEIGEQHMAVQCDVGDPGSVRAAFEKIAERHPKIDVLINNAGIFEPFTLAESDDAKVIAMMLTNFGGPIFVTREGLKLMERGGHVINVTSESVRVKFPMLWMYESTKAAVEHMSESIGRDLEAEGIRMTALRAGQMMDETKTATAWPMDVAMRFHEQCAAAGINPRERPIAHYNAVTDAFRAVIDSPPQVHIPFVALSAWKP